MPETGALTGRLYRIPFFEVIIRSHSILLLYENYPYRTAYECIQEYFFINMALSECEVLSKQSSKPRGWYST